MSFSPTDAAFEGFRVTRREPKTLIALSLLYVALTSLILTLSFQPIKELVGIMQTMSGSGPASEEDAMHLMSLYGQIMGWSFVPSLLVGAIVNAAVARSVFQPENNKYGYLRLGKTELRILAANLLVMLMIGAVAILGTGIMGVMFGLAANGMPALALVGVVVFLAAMVAVIWLVVKLSLAVPMTFTQQRIVVLGSFAATKGHYWPLLGMILLAVILSTVVSLLGSIIITPLMMLTGGLAVLPEATGISAPLVAALFAWVLLNSLMSAAQLLILYAPFSSAWKSISAS